MVLCAVVSLMLELMSIPKAINILLPVISAAGAAAALFVPRGEEGKNLVAMISENRAQASAIILPCACLCIVLSSVVSMINRRFVPRCVAAGCAAIFLIVLIIMKMTVMPVVAALLLAYVLMVACQAFAPKGKTDDAGRRESWYVVICAAAAALAMLMPMPETRIPWEKLIHLGRSQQLEMLGDALEIDSLDEELPKVSGVDDDASDMGGWLETSISQPVEVSFSDGASADRLTGSLYDSYTGKGWLCTISITDTGYVSGTDASDIENCGRATVRKISTQGETVFMPPNTVYIDPRDGAGTERSGSRLVFSDPHLGPYTAYFTDSQPSLELTENERKAYLTLPETVTARVRDMADLVTRHKDGDEEKAQAIMDLLSRYRYNTKVDSVPEGADLADHFLFESREGYCEYFATAMAVLARCANIPSRLAIGYAVPKSRTQPITMTSANAHAWAELYIEGKGWVVYDPTTFAAVIEPPDEEEEEQDEGLFSSENVAALKKTLLYTYASIAGFAALFFIFRPFVRRMISKSRLKRSYGKKDGYAVLRRCGALLRTFSACGIKRAESETAQEFGVRVAEECEWLTIEAKEKVSALLSQSGAVLYSNGKPENKTVSGASGAVRRAYIKKFGLLRIIRGWWKAEV